MNEENKVITPNETPETTVEDTNAENTVSALNETADTAVENTKENASEQVADDKKGKKGKKNKPKKNKEKGSFKAFLKSRKARHGSLAIVIVAVVVAIVIVLNVICGLLVDRFPDLKLDLTANQSFALQDDTIDYVSHLNKDVTLYVLMPENEVENQGTYFIQAKNLLDKIKSNSNGKIDLKYIDLTSNPTFTSNYPNVDWSSESGNNYFMLVECGEQYRALKVEDCFEYDETTYSYYGQYQFTGTTIEQAVVTAILNVTADDKVVVDMIKGNNEQDYSAIKTLLENNAYEVNEISLVTQAIDDDAEFIMIYAPSVDLDESAVEKISDWLDNDGKYGRTLIYVPCDEKVDTPNIDALLDQWGMQVDDGYVFETNTDYLISGSTPYAFITDYSDYYKDNLKNSKIPVVVSYAHDIIIKDSEMAHSLLTTSDKAGVQPYDYDENWNYEDAMTGEPLNIAAEGVKTNNDEKSSRVVVLGSPSMLNETVMSYNSYNNSAYFMNVVNTIADKDDNGITIESKSLESAELGVTDVTTQSVMIAIFVVILPAAILIAGLIVWLRRRNR